MRVIAEQLRAMRQEVSKILRTLGSASWNSTAPPDIAQRSRPNTISESIEPKLYGRDLIMNSIIHDITQTQGKYCDKNLTVLPIVGPGGIGKTTLAQHIYHNQQVQKHFQVMVWKCVSLNFNVDKITEDIEKYIPPVQDETEGTAGELIGQRLKSKRFLLVLDDMWKCGDEDGWKRLLLPFQKSQVKGNIIIVTTRFPALAKMVKTTHHSIDLEGLYREDFKELFLALVFGDEQSRQDHTVLLKTGYKIMDKLKGSPLAAKTVGRLLRNDLDLDHWTRVLESKEWELQRGDHDIMPALKLSYDYLPSDLQQCFSYCALFPQDYKFDSKELIHFWIGQDILHSGDQNNLNDEDIGLRNINDLVSHGFFKKDETEGCPHYIIHDLLHDLALKVASHECLSVHSYNVISGKIRPSIRHLSIILDSTNDSDIMADENLKSELRKLCTRLKVGSLQSLMIFGAMDESFASAFNDLFGEANALRLLCLPQMIHPVESVLHNFSTAVHLRYLRLGTFSSDCKLPSILSRFYHLKILDLQGWFDHQDFPRIMSNLLNLRHFLVDYDELHSNISNVGKLQFLQELKVFRVNEESNGFELKQLENLIELRELGIYNLEKIHTKEEATEAKLIEKRYLRKLTLDWDNKRHNVEHVAEALVLESLQPHRKLHELCIRGHGGPSCPTWLGDHISDALQSLHLDGIAWEVLPPLGCMWVLQKLTLKNIPSIKEFGPIHFGSITEHSFLKLKKLSVIGLQQLEKWVMGETCRHLLPQLQRLIIRDCPKLLGLPFDNFCYPTKHDLEGKIHWFPNLQVLEINNCPKVMSLPPIPWTQTLRSVDILCVGSSLLDSLKYSKSSSVVQLTITGKDDLHSLLDDQILVLNNLIDLQQLRMRNCPPLELKHLQMLTLLEIFDLQYSSHVFVPSGSEGEVKCQLPAVKHLLVEECGANGKELRELLSHLPKLRRLDIGNCEKITRMMGVVLEQQELTTNVPAPSSPTLTMDDTQAACHEWQISTEVEKEEKLDDGLLIFPDHLCDSLKELCISKCPELSVVASPFHIDYKTGGRGGEGGGLQALRSLERLRVRYCPKFLSACKTSSCCPFPSTLQTLELIGVEGMGTLEPLSNITSLTELVMYNCGEDLRSDGLWPLVTQGQLSYLMVYGSPKFFVGLRALQDGYQLHRSSKLRELETDDVAGVLSAPICSLLSSSLTKLVFSRDYKAERFTKQQEEALQLLTSLQHLSFTGCDKLQCLPAGLHSLTNLKILFIWFCPAISSLPEGGLPSSLQQLSVSHDMNEELRQQCRNVVQSHPQIKLTVL